MERRLVPLMRRLRSSRVVLLMHVVANALVFSVSAQFYILPINTKIRRTTRMTARPPEGSSPTRSCRAR
jgi:hypothetical protein